MYQALRGHLVDERDGLTERIGNGLRIVAVDRGANIAQCSPKAGTKLPAIDARRVRPAIESLFRTDLDLKSSGGDARVLLERLVVELCRG